MAHRLDRTLSVMDRGAGYGGAGNSNRIRSGGGGQREIMRRVTGDELLYIGAYPNSRKERQAMLEAGGAQRSGGPGHVATLAMRKIGDTWAIVRGDQYDGRDRVISVIRDLKNGRKRVRARASSVRLRRNGTRNSKSRTLSNPATSARDQTDRTARTTTMKLRTAL